MARASVGRGLSLACLLVLIGALPAPTARAQLLFGNPEFRVGERPASVAIGDLDGDGDADLAVPNAGGDNVSVLLNNGDGTLAAHVLYGAGEAPWSVAIGDLDSDGDADLAVANVSSDNVSVLLNLTNPPRRGDLNCDASVNAFDIDPFVLAIVSAGHEVPFDDYLAAFPDCDPLLADCNGDGAVNAFDIDPFVQCLTVGCP